MKEVWLGDVYPESWYDHLDSDIQDCFCEITEVTKQDLARLHQFLESLGIVVRRPSFTKIENFLDPAENLKKPPITPRDHFLVLGDTLWNLHPDTSVSAWNDVMDNYVLQGSKVLSPVKQPINCLCPPSLVRVGKDLFVDRDTHPHVWGYICEWMIDTAKDYRINICETSGHSDGVFCPVGPGVIAASQYKSKYDVSFPGWEVFHVPPELHNFTPKSQIYPWHINFTDKKNNKKFFDHIVSRAMDWVGNQSETVFEVNMLVIDEKNVICMKEYQPLFEWLEQKGITAHVFDFRARSFWDGGWHCLTLDIHRNGGMIDYWPERGAHGVYWRID